MADTRAQAAPAAEVPGGELMIPASVNVGNVNAVLESIAAECRARRYTAESRVVVNLAQLADFDSSVLSMLLEMGRYAGKPLAAINPPPKLRALAELYGVSDLLLSSQDEAAA
ncbi:MAG: STAS domain-containing protein [Lautropia sp.]|nr:STAS domain-containing protein [Lautropia sp.]